MTEPATRFGFAAVIGAPNAGKSTLVNALTGAKVSIVTHKVQTTRMPIRAAYVDGASQVILVDTPGIFEPRRRLDRAMVQSAWSGADDADLTALLIDARSGLTGMDETILDRLASHKGRKFLVINKVDLVKPDALLALASDVNARCEFERTFMISALNGDGVADLRMALCAAMPPGGWHYPADHLSDLPLRMMAAEITREKLFLRVHDELPYALTVETERWDDRRDGSVKIDQTIYVAREAHRKILLGKGGRMIKAVSVAAREEIGAILGQTVHLFLFVKVRPKWIEDPERYREIGLDIHDRG